MTTGQLIKKARKSAGMTQLELSKKLNIPFQSVSQWERDIRNPKVETLQRIADALDVFWVDLVPEDKQGEAIAENVERNIKNTPELPETTAYAIEELLFYAGEATGRYRGLREGLGPEAFEITKLLVRLNSDGKQKAIERIKELTEIPRYQTQRPPRSILESTEGTDTTPPPDGSEGSPEAK